MELSGRSLPHIIVPGTPESVNYERPGSWSGENQYKRRESPSEHARKLLGQLELALEEAKEAGHADFDTDQSGSYLRFDGEYDIGSPEKLAIDKLQDRRWGTVMDLCSVKVEEVTADAGEDASQRVKRLTATAYIPEKKESTFKKKVERYGEKTPENDDPVSSIASIRAARIEDFWTDPIDDFPEPDEQIWWEVWIRHDLSNQSIRRYNRIRDQDEHALPAVSSIESMGLTVADERVFFPEHAVVLVRATPEKLNPILNTVNSLAELRRATESASFYMSLNAAESVQSIQHLKDRIHRNDDNAVSICLLDTGVNRDHPLLNDSLAETEMHAYEPDWGTADEVRMGGGHGTEMAGLALYGDLTRVLTSGDKVELDHCLESVKIFRPQRQTEKLLWGYITRESINRVEIEAPERRRVINCTVTARDNSNLGRPSSWSSIVDQLCSGANEEKQRRRLFIQAAGNLDHEDVGFYPDANQTEGVHDPGQAWNALTVGSYTMKADVEEETRWTPVAARGGLGPTSTTSCLWDHKMWPYKPDIVLEGGNWATHEDDVTPDQYPDSLRLLSTNARFRRQYFNTTGDTSAACTLASRMAAKISAAYPELWPETVRGLIVHSGQWTTEMLEDTSVQHMSEDQIRELMRLYGYGVPSLRNAMYSARDSLTLISQGSLQPFEKVDGASRCRAKDMNLHELPWPEEVLYAAGQFSPEVKMRVTLSYFIEPNPGSRVSEYEASTNKFKYPSHGLDFRVCRVGETPGTFRARINEQERDDTYVRNQNDGDGWLLGPNVRRRGSIQSDVWRGSASGLAMKGLIAVRPITGWWKTRHHLEKYDSVAKYALIVSLETEKLDADIYTPVKNKVGIDISA